MSKHCTFYSDGEILIGKSRLHRMISRSKPSKKEAITKKDYILLNYLIEQDVEYLATNLFDELEEWFKVVEEQ